MTQTEIREKLNALLAPYLPEGAAPVTEQTDLHAELGLSSYSILSLIGNIEDAFGIRICYEDVTRLTTVGDVEAYLAQRLAQR